MGIVADHERSVSDSIHKGRVGLQGNPACPEQGDATPSAKVTVTLPFPSPLNKVTLFPASFHSILPLDLVTLPPPPPPLPYPAPRTSEMTSKDCLLLLP